MPISSTDANLMSITNGATTYLYKAGPDTETYLGRGTTTGV